MLVLIAVAVEPGAANVLRVALGIQAWLSWLFLMLFGSVVTDIIYLPLPRHWGGSGEKLCFLFRLSSRCLSVSSSWVSDLLYSTGLASSLCSPACGCVFRRPRPTECTRKKGERRNWPTRFQTPEFDRGDPSTRSLTDR